MEQPKSCPSAGECKSTTFDLIQHETVYQDYQEIKIQEQARVRAVVPRPPISGSTLRPPFCHPTLRPPLLWISGGWWCWGMDCDKRVFILPKPPVVPNVPSADQILKRQCPFECAGARNEKVQGRSSPSPIPARLARQLPQPATRSCPRRGQGRAGPG